ncbi:MAG: hypothetical protein K8Q89_08410 [Nitrosarchaeum sp.]|nr:hypothetical protein [Nitrosarchaeum sp.]
MKTKGSTNLAIQQRREMVMLIIGTIKNEGRIVTVDLVHQRMLQIKLKNGKKPYSTIDRSTIGNDMKKINVENTFVRDLSQYNYSALKENIFASLQWIYGEAKKNYEKTWTLSKTITRKIKEDVFEEVITTEEIAGPKIAFLNIMKECTKEMNEIQDGRSSQISVALLSQRFVELERELDEANQYESKYEKLRSSKHIQD